MKKILLIIICLMTQILIAQEKSPKTTLQINYVFITLGSNITEVLNSFINSDNCVVDLEDTSDDITYYNIYDNDKKQLGVLRFEKNELRGITKFWDLKDSYYTSDWISLLHTIFEYVGNDKITTAKIFAQSKVYATFVSKSVNFELDKYWDLKLVTLISTSKNSNASDHNVISETIDYDY